MTQMLEVIEIEDEQSIEFDGYHKDYGRAEFEICIMWKRNKISEVFIYPKQQDVNHYYHYKPKNPYSTSISYSGYQGLDSPEIWFQYWCKDHKTVCTRLYVPEDSKYLWFHPLSTLTIGFIKNKI